MNRLDEKKGSPHCEAMAGQMKWTGGDHPHGPTMTIEATTEFAPPRKIRFSPRTPNAAMTRTGGPVLFRDEHYQNESKRNRFLERC
jgi:hypothetical protein